MRNPKNRKSRGGGVLGLIFAGYVPLACQSPYLIIIYSVANYRPHLSHFWANMRERVSSTTESKLSKSRWIKVSKIPCAEDTESVCSYVTLIGSKQSNIWNCTNQTSCLPSVLFLPNKQWLHAGIIFPPLPPSSPIFPRHPLPWNHFWLTPTLSQFKRPHRWHCKIRLLVIH